MFDMGPYYLTALVTLLGPVQRVTGATRISFPERTIASQPLAGQTITVNVPTHVTGLLDFAGGPIATIVTSFDVWSHNTPRLEIYGSEGTLSLPDPNTFGGPVRLRGAKEREWTDVPLTHGNIGNSRGLGVLDMAGAIRGNRPQRASGDLAFHVLDIMHAVHDASQAGRHIVLESTVTRPAPQPAGMPNGMMELLDIGLPGANAWRRAQFDQQCSGDRTVQTLADQGQFNTLEVIRQEVAVQRRPAS